ncbi:hypothetical protein BJ170DRAFT_324852 [Xylariales sp. AK1849]|nr:hypothetical protein BJ170DRAFT_324852 [Xylariales sp. AK1849]
MVWSRTFIGFVALVATVEPAEAQNSSSLFGALPSCSLPCLLTSVASANCSTTNVAAFEECLCTNVTMQSALSYCFQTSCTNYTDVAVALYAENKACDAFPKQTQGPKATTTAIVAIAVSVPIVIARCTSRWTLTHRLWMDDYMAVLATLFLVALAAMEVVSVEKGFGLHLWNYDSRNSVALLQILYAAQILYVVVQCLAKISILFLYQRVFDTGGNRANWFRWAVRGLLVLTFFYGVVLALVMVFQCFPVSAIWDKSVTNAKCLNVYVSIGTGAILGIIGDFVLIAMPIPMLRKLKISRRKKVGVALMFAIASLGTVASIVRLKQLIGLSKSYDASYQHVDVIVWSLIELICVVVCGSLPALRPYLNYLFPRLGVTRQKSNGPNGSKGSSSKQSVFFAKPVRLSRVGTFSDDKRDSCSLSPLPMSGAPNTWEEFSKKTHMPEPAVVRHQTHVEDDVDVESQKHGHHGTMLRTSSSESEVIPTLQR